MLAQEWAVGQKLNGTGVTKPFVGQASERRY